jgi:hypothetical protein
MLKRNLLSTTAFAPPSEITAAAPKPPKTQEQSAAAAVRQERLKVPRRAYSPDAFCVAYDLSIPFLYKLWSKGEGPARFKVGNKVLITCEAAERWRRAQQRKSKAASA